mmetsp:Transcript_15247/g.34145  ORF Transcript_15247/g.34145 Transcript_15247/m.34145 type:complete len:196 (+) Transcript_15247:573-1160(+)
MRLDNVAPPRISVCEYWRGRKSGRNGVYFVRFESTACFFCRFHCNRRRSVDFSFGVVAQNTPRKNLIRSNLGEDYWLPLTEKYGEGNRRIVLIEDSVANLRAAERAFGWEGILVTSSGPEEYKGEIASSPREAVRKALGIIPPSSRHVFDSVQYLKAKNAVDAVSIDRTVWNRFQAEVGRRRKVSEDGYLKIVDL